MKQLMQELINSGAAPAGSDMLLPSEERDCDLLRPLMELVLVFPLKRFK